MKHLALTALTLALVASAQAENYLGGTIGASQIDIDCGGLASCDNGDTGFKLYAGFDVARRASVNGLALEVGYIDFGKATASYGPARASVEVSAVTFAAALRGQFTPALAGVARLGLGYVEGKASGSVAGFSAGSESSSELKLYGGLGLEYSLNKQFKLVGAADFTTYDTGHNSGSASLISFGAQYGF